MKKTYHLLFLLLFLSPVPARAYVGLCCSKCGGNMPLNIPGGGVPETHEFRFKLQYTFMSMDGLRRGTAPVDPDAILGMPATGRFMAAPGSMDMQMSSLSAGYSFTDDLFAGVMFMWKRASMDMKFSPMMRASTGRRGFTMESEGYGDTMVMGKYRLLTDDPLIPTSQVSLLFGLSLPTGSIDGKNSKHPVSTRRFEQLPYGMQLGSGTVDPLLGLLYQGSSSPWWWGADLAYKARPAKNRRGYRLGDEFSLDLYAMYQVRYDTVVHVQLNTRRTGRIRGEMDEAVTGASGRAARNDASSGYASPLWETRNYGGTNVNATAGLQWQPLPMHVIELDVGLPLYRDLNGPQLEEYYRVMVTWYVEVPTEKSIRYTGARGGGKSRLGF